jgi:hypothetical protein
MMRTLISPSYGPLLLSLFLYSIGSFFTPAQAQDGYGFVNWESAHVHPIDITPSMSTVLAVNTADHRLEVFDLDNNGMPQHRLSIPVGLDPVTVRARTDSEAWVVNHISNRSAKPDSV